MYMYNWLFVVYPACIPATSAAGILVYLTLLSFQLRQVVVINLSILISWSDYGCV